jgi:hypothetical protein
VGSCSQTKPSGTSCQGGTCQNGICAVCANGQINSAPCDLGKYGQGKKTRECTNGRWESYGDCRAAFSYYGDGPTHCGSVLCVTISPEGSDSQLTATITKNGDGSFENDLNVSIYSPTTSLSQQFGCLAATDKSSVQVSFSPERLGVSVGATITVATAG